MELHRCNHVLRPCKAKLKTNSATVLAVCMLFMLCVLQTACGSGSAFAAGTSGAALSSGAAGTTEGSGSGSGTGSGAAASPSSTPSVPSTFFGMTLLQPGTKTLVPFGTVRAWDTNHATWTFLNPSRGVYTWNNLDSWVASQSGKDLVYTFGLTPGWAASNPAQGTPYGYGSSCSMPANMADWDAFVTAIATHVAGKVKYWELWNEPMNTIYFCGDIPTFVTMAQHARSIIKSIDPSAMIVAPSTDKPFGEAWIKNFLSSGGAATIDVMAVHGYPDNSPEGIVPMLAQYRALMAGYGIGNLPIFDTETNGGPNGASDVAKMFLLEWSSGVQRTMLYSYEGLGLSDPSGLTPTGTAYGELYKWMVGASLNAPCSQDTAGTYTCNLARSDYQAEAVWNSTNSATITVLPQFVQYRDLQGNVHPIQNGTVTAGSSPILIETAANDSTQLSFANIAQHTYGDVPFPVYASSASNGNVTYSVVSGPATMSGSVVTLTGAGTVVLSASQQASGNFLSTSATTTFTVAPKPVPTLLLAPIADAMVYAGPVTVKATSNSPAAITYSIASGPATLSGTRVTFTGSGTVVVAATQPETATLAAATTTTSFQVKPKPVPTLAFTPVGTKSNGAPGFNVAANSNSPAPIVYSIVSGPASNSHNSWVTISGAGTVVVQAAQAETSTYAAATATTSFSVLAKPVPTLTMTPIATITYGAAGFNVGATSNSPSPTVYSILSGPASLSHNSWLTPSGPGTVVVQAAQVEATNYAAASATTSFTVLAKPVPTLSITPIGSKTNGASGFNVAATSNSTAPVTFSIVSGPATLSHNNWITVTGAGTVVVQASQAEISTYAAATATTSFNVTAKPIPTLAFTPVATKTNGTAAFPVQATSNSNGAISYSIVSGPASVNNNYVTLTGAGTVTVKATQAEVSTYATTTATTSFTVLAKPTPKLTLPTMGTVAKGVTAVPLTAASNSNGAITYSVVSGPATISGSSAVISGTGTVVIQATQAEVSTYAATTATTSFTVSAKTVPTLTFTPIATVAKGVTSVPLKASSNSTGAITYTVVSGPATVSGSSALISDVGTVVIKATQAETSAYAMTSASTSFNVSAKPVPTLTVAPVPNQTYGAGGFNVTATSSSNAPILFSIVSGPATSTHNSWITTSGVGTVTVQATQVETTTYAPATATITFKVLPKPVPTLTITPVAAQTYGASGFNVTATSNSNAPILFSVVSGPATSTHNSWITTSGPGTVVIQATQVETTAYAPSTATTTFTVLPKTVPTLAFVPIGTKTNGQGGFSVAATSNSTAAILFSIVSGPATIAHNSWITISGEGTVVVQATQAEIGTFASATATTSFTVLSKPVPTLTLPTIGTQTYGSSPLYLKAASNSYGAITYSLVSGPATLSNNAVTLTGIGTVTIKATQVEIPTYAAATTNASFDVVAMPLVFGTIAKQTYGNAPFAVSATSQSTGPITYSVLSGPGTIAGSTVTATGAGTIVIGASQAAAGMFPAMTATTSVTVAQRVPTLAFVAIAAQSVDKPPFAVSATSASGGAITYSVLSGPATISGSTVTMTGVGTVLLGASQAATDDYTAATTTATFGIAASNGSTPAAVAARILDQSSFGPTMSTIAHVQSVGVEGYLQEQFTAPPTTLARPTSAIPVCSVTGVPNCVQTEFWTATTSGPDQLRQRVAFAFSEIFSVSAEGVDWLSIPQYQNVLVNDAFGNYETLLKDVALTPAMGGYLNMTNSAAQGGGKIANENFARENMQLFTTGTSLLNSDGSLQLDGNGAPIPVYTEEQVQAFAKAFTGWTYATANGGIPTWFPNGQFNYYVPLVAEENYHDTSSKTLLNNTVLPGGQTAEQDLDGAISNVFNHPNTGPFVCRQLIQHLVTSTPSPAYIARVAAVFANNGAGVRGDLQAVVRAILTDEEARAGDTSENLNDGHQREPILFLTGMARGLQMTNTDGVGSKKGLSMAAASLNETPFTAPSVFNFFPADYMLPGTTINAPEFGLENTAQVSIRLSLADQIVRNALFGYSVDLSNTSTLGTLATNPATLVDTLSTLFLHAQMPDEMRSTIVNAITPLTSPAQRARVAVYLVVTSPQYNVIH